MGEVGAQRGGRLGDTEKRRVGNWGVCMSICAFFLVRVCVCVCVCFFVGKEEAKQKKKKTRQTDRRKGDQLVCKPQRDGEKTEERSELTLDSSLKSHEAYMKRQTPKKKKQHLLFHCNNSV